MSIEDDSLQYICKTLDTFDNPQLLEVGTFEGYSAEQFSTHVTRMLTIEKDERAFLKAKEFLKNVKNVSLLHADAKEVLTHMSNMFDVAFIDATKKEYAEYFLAIVPLMNPNGVIFLDNTISHRDKMEELFIVLESQGFRWKELGLGKGLIEVKV